MKTLIERLRFHASDAWPYATMVSNMGHPESDNNFGRAATDMVEAADRIAQLEAALHKARNVWHNYRIDSTETENAVLREIDVLLGSEPETDVKP